MVFLPLVEVLVLQVLILVHTYLTGIAADPGRPSIRFSFSKYNTKEELDYVVEKVKHIVEQNVSV